MRNYKNFNVWRKGHDLVIIVYQKIAPAFPDFEKFGLTSQLRRAAYSIPFNIAEGCARSSQKDFVHFLDISLGSAQEVEYCILLARDLSLINEEEYLLVNGLINEIKAMIITLIKKIREEIRTLNSKKL